MSKDIEDWFMIVLVVIALLLGTLFIRTTEWVKYEPPVVEPVKEKLYFNTKNDPLAAADGNTKE